MKGLATQTIVLLILALIVLGILAGLIFIGGGPFRASAEFNACKGRLTQWCLAGRDLGTFEDAMGGLNGPCLGRTWPGYKPTSFDQCRTGSSSPECCGPP